MVTRMHGGSVTLSSRQKPGIRRSACGDFAIFTANPLSRRLVDPCCYPALRGGHVWVGPCSARRAGPSSEKGDAVLMEWARLRGAGGRGLWSPALSRLDNALEPPAAEPLPHRSPGPRLPRGSSQLKLQAPRPEEQGSSPPTLSSRGWDLSQDHRTAGVGVGAGGESGAGGVPRTVLGPESGYPARAFAGQGAGI